MPSGLLLPAHRVETPRTGAGSCEIKKDEAVEDRQLAFVQDRKEALRGMHHEIGDRRHARGQERGRPGEQADDQQNSADEFDDAGIARHGIEIEGRQMRYARLAKDLNEVCGLGIMHIAEVVSFDEPATFRLKRMPENTIRLTTSTGISLTEEWLQGQPRCVEVSTLGNWIDVTASCPSGSIPSQVVKEWSEHNQRTLVDFRISL